MGAAREMATLMKLGHFPLMALFALLTAALLACLGCAKPRERAKAGIRYFLLFLGAALAIGWLMYPFSR